MTAATQRLLVAFVLIGLGASGASTYVHAQLLSDPAYVSFCDVNATVSCSQVYLSRYGSVARLPVGYLGVLWFALSGLLLVGARRGTPKLRARVPAYLFAWSTVGLAVVLYLAYASFVVLNAVCLLCVTVYVAVAGLFVVTGASASIPMSQVPGLASRDLRRLVATPAGLGTVVAFVAAAGLGAAWLAEPAAGSGAGAPVLTLSAAEREEFLRWWGAQPRVELPIADGGAAVLVVKFNDYMCPPCRQTYLNYQPVFAKYDAVQPGAVKLVTKHYPLDPECNDTAPNGVHHASCEAAAAVRLAERTGQAEPLEAWLFEHQATLSPVSVAAAAREVGGVEDFAAEYPAMLESIREDIALGVTLGVEATPTFVINGVRITGGLTVPYFDAAIAYELERASGSQD